MHHRQLLVVSGPSGVGKSSLIAEVLRDNKDLHLAVSATTRKRRPGEVEGKDYYFVTDEQFDALIDEDAFVEWAHVHGNRNGTLKSELSRALELNKPLILDIDTQGAAAIRKLFPRDSYLIFILPPSESELRDRLRQRATEDAHTFEIRMNNGAEELKKSGSYDKVIVNDDFLRTVDELKCTISEIIASESGN